MKIEVTQDHIDQGFRKSCRGCPVARAICDAYPGEPIVLVDGADVMVYEEDQTSVLYDLPLEAVLFIKDYDVRNPVEPFTFTLEEA
ncbi:hypothetical protein [Candidatus Poriferisocius sp.]|uniref:hypothetical protein n=1 Tax=Candidatus Poriferisocius sp. TaxID=3101276 RepID=UPI003B518DA4